MYPYNLSITVRVIFFLSVVAMFGSRNAATVISFPSSVIPSLKMRLNHQLTCSSSWATGRGKLPLVMFYNGPR